MNTVEDTNRIENSLEFVHPQHPIPDEIAMALLRRDEQERLAQEQRFEIAKLARPTADWRRLETEYHEHILRSAGMEIEGYRSQASDISKEQLERIERIGLSGQQLYGDIIEIDFQPPGPGSDDPSFWFANWNASWSPPFSAEGMADGIHFRGKKTYDDGDLLFLNFGVKSRYELHANRVPRPNRGPWRSAPNVELFGELWGWTGPGGLFEGDRWSKCWMIRRQTLYQFIFGMDGPVARTIGEATDVQTLIFEENRGRHVIQRLPGFQPMPQVVLTSIFPGISIWAELEVRFDIQLEGNSFLWIHPFDLLLRGFQWPLEPL